MTKSNSTDERGLAHVLLFVFAVTVLAVIGFVGWQVMNRHTASSNASLVTQTGTKPAGGTVYSNCLMQFHDQAVCHFAAVQSAHPLDKSAYKATVTTSQSDGSSGALVYEQDGKGNNSLTTSGSSAGSDINSVTVNGVLYVKNGDTWIKYPTSADQPATQDPASDLSFMNSIATTKFSKVATVSCGSSTCDKYQYTDSASPGTTDYIWFDTHSYLLNEWSSTDPHSGATDMQITYQPITINVPSPVVNFEPTM